MFETNYINMRTNSNKYGTCYCSGISIGFAIVILNQTF